MSRERERKIIGQIKLGSTGSHKVEVIIRFAFIAILLRVNVYQLMLMLLNSFQILEYQTDMRRCRFDINIAPMLELGLMPVVTTMVVLDFNWRR